MSIIEIDTLDQFNEILLNTTDKKFLLVDFYADWCGPCKRMDPYLENFSETHNENLVYSRVNVDKKQLHPLMKNYKVRCMPTFILLPIGSTDVPNVYPTIKGFDPDTLEKTLAFHNQ